MASVHGANAEGGIDEEALFERVSAIIENRKQRAASRANSEITLMYWEVGRYINSVVLDFKRAEYGKRVVSTLSQRLIVRYGQSFALRNLRRILQFAEQFSDFEIVSPLATQLSWSHFIRTGHQTGPIAVQQTPSPAHCY